MSDVAVLTDTVFGVHHHQVFVQTNPDGWHAIMEWFEFHGIDPRDVCAASLTFRDEPGCRIIYVGRSEFQTNLDGWPLGEFSKLWVTKIQQGETPPLPWPAELERYRG